jgi:hypothetical protein
LTRTIPTKSGCVLEVSVHAKAVPAANVAKGKSTVEVLIDNDKVLVFERTCCRPIRQLISRLTVSRPGAFTRWKGGDCVRCIKVIGKEIAEETDRPQAQGAS